MSPPLSSVVEGVCGSPMTMPPVARCVLGVDEEERDEKDAGLSILHGVHRRGT
jgi:hypothetical protein